MAASAVIARQYLKFMLSCSQLDCLIVWSLVAHYSWLQTRNILEDGASKWPTVYDPNYTPKLMREAIADAFSSEPRGGN